MKRDPSKPEAVGAPLWRLGELGQQVAAALAAVRPPNGRVREVPDLRSIRYYTTLGMIDRPAEMRGRTAYYGVRHLRQLVAIKRLQAAGNSLASIQVQLAGIDDQKLAALAGVPAELTWATGTGEGISPASPPPSLAVPSNDRRRSFWRNPGQGALPVTTAEPGPEVLPATAASEPSEECATRAPLQTLSLGREVVLVLGGVRALDADDVAALRAAAAPLLQVLEQRELVELKGERGLR